MISALRPRNDGWIVLPVLVVAAAMLGIAAALGPVGLLAPVVAAVLITLLLHPSLTLATILGTTVVLEADRQGFLPATARFYTPVLGTKFIAMDGLLLILAAGVALDLARRRQAPRLPGIFTFPLLLVAIGTVGGIVTGLASHGVAYNMFSTGRTFAYLAVLPFLVVNVVDGPRAARRWILGAALLIAFKGLEGTLAYVVGAGRSVGDSSTLAYYEATANWLILVYLLTLVTAFMLRHRIANWLWLGAPLAVAAFALSFRRGFWIGAAVGLLTIFMLVGVRHARRLGAVLAIGLVPAVTVAVLVGSGVVSNQNPLLARIESISVTKVTSSVQDRYRLDEESNVLPQLITHPLSGLGLGVPWHESEHPVSIWFTDQFLYDHVTVIWWWMKLGALGLIAYLSVMGALIIAALQLWRSRKDDIFRVVGMGVLAGSVGLLVAEQTNAATGVQFRFTLVLAGVIGLLSAALRDGRSANAQETRVATA